MSVRSRTGRGWEHAHLILYVGAITALVDLDVEVIGAWTADMGGDVELAGVPRPLRVADLAMIHPHGKGGVDTLKPQPQLVPLVLEGEIKRSHVAAALIVINRHAGRINREGKVEIGILRAFAVALELPHARDAYGLAVPAVLRDQATRLVLVEVDGALEGRPGQVEQPVPREQLALGARDITREGVVSMAVQKEVGTRREGVPMEDLEVVPVRGGRRPHVGRPCLPSLP